MRPWIRSSRSRRRAPKYVLAARTDGLGERLNALLNAIRLSDLLGVEFRFTWPPANEDNQSDRAIVPADEFFSADFLAAHGVDHDEWEDGFVLPAGPADDLDSLRAQLESAERGLWAPNRSLAHRIDPQALLVILRGYSSEFSRIGFDPRIEAAISAARAVPLGVDPVGIHLRSGDIVHGRFRIWMRFTEKVMSAPVARNLIETYRGAGSMVLVFGQEADLIKRLCASTGAVDAATLRPATEMSDVAAAMFDMVLMSRCAHIISGPSGFAIQAASVGDKKEEDFRDLLTASEIVAITRADLARHGETYHPRIRAFASWSAYYWARRKLTSGEAIELIGAALEADPDNPRYQLRAAGLEYREGRQARGDAALRDALMRDAARGIETLDSVLLFAAKHSSNQYDCRDVVTDIGRAADEGSGIAALYRAGLRATVGATDGSAEDVASFEAQIGADDPLTRIEALDALVRATLAELTATGGAVRPSPRWDPVR